MATPSSTLSRIAASQHGVVTRRQLLGAGLSVDEVAHRVRLGVLLREHPGVYRVGHRAPSTEARYLAAVLACGDDALLTARAAAHLYGLIKGPAPPPEVTTKTHRRLPGVITKRTRHQPEPNTHRGIPITAVPRTLVDLASHLPLDALARACHEAGVRYGTTPRQVQAAMSPHTKGAAKLRAILHGDTPITVSELERRFIKLLTAQRLPLPKTNRPAGSRRVDCRWPELRLTVELDSYRFHNSRHTWEQDRRREREAYARGDQIRRYTYADVTEQPASMLAELRALLLPARAATTA